MLIDTPLPAILRAAGMSKPSDLCPMPLLSMLRRCVSLKSTSTRNAARVRTPDTASSVAVKLEHRRLNLPSPKTQSVSTACNRVV